MWIKERKLDTKIIKRNDYNSQGEVWSVGEGNEKEGKNKIEERITKSRNMHKRAS